VKISFQFESYMQFIKQASGCKLTGFAASVPPCLSNEVSATAYRDATPNASLLGLFNVGYVVTPLSLEGSPWTLRATGEGRYLYHNEAVLPRAFGVGKLEPTTTAMLWDRLAEVEVDHVALIEADVVEEPLPQNWFHAPAQMVAHEPNRIRVRVDMPAEGMLVIGEVWTPGWQATDNGAPARVLRVNGTMRGVHLAAGSHDVTLEFRLPAFRHGLAISGLTTLFCAAILIVSSRRTRS
jgi:hypothetical protein